MRYEMKTFPRMLRLWTALGMLLVLGAFDVAPAVAGLAASTTSGASAIASVRDADLLLAQRALEHKIVAQKLRDYGVSSEDVQLRLATMSDEDLHTLASAARGLPSGGDSAGALISLLIIVLLVILIIKLMNKEIIVR